MTTTFNPMQTQPRAQGQSVRHVSRLLVMPCNLIELSTIGNALRRVCPHSREARDLRYKPWQNEPAINLKTATLLGLAIPRSVLARANEVIA